MQADYGTPRAAALPNIYLTPAGRPGASNIVDGPAGSHFIG